MEKQDVLEKSWNDLVVPDEKIDMVLIDDDPIFCSLMAEHARRMSINLHFFHDLMEVQNSGNLQKYQVAILDYQLEQMNGLEVANWIPSFFNDMPIILVSYEDRTEQNTSTSWPGSVRCFVHKREGVKSILAHAIALSEQLKREREYMQRQEAEKLYGPGPYQWLLGEHSIKQKLEENMHSLEQIISRNVHKMVDRFVRHKEYSDVAHGDSPERANLDHGQDLRTTADQVGPIVGSTEHVHLKAMNQL